MSKNKNQPKTLAQVFEEADKLKKEFVADAVPKDAYPDRCENCIAARFDALEGCVRCHAGPPTWMSQYNTSPANWPVVKPESWCMQHKRVKQ